MSDLTSKLAVGLVAILLLLRAEANATPTVQIQPAVSQTPQGNLVTVDVTVGNMVDLYAFQFDLSFNPAILQAISSSEGAFLETGGVTLFIPGSIDNTSGEINFLADTLLTALSGVSGDGVLGSITFSAVSPGSSSLTLSNLLFLDSTLAEIEGISTAGGTINVTPPSTRVPEPGSFLLLVLGLALFPRMIRHLNQDTCSE